MTEYILLSQKNTTKKLYGLMRVLDTPCGRLLNEAIENDLHIKFSLRSFAKSTKLEGFEIVHEDGFDLITIDAYVRDKIVYEKT